MSAAWPTRRAPELLCSHTVTKSEACKKKSVRSNLPPGRFGNIWIGSETRGDSGGNVCCARFNKGPFTMRGSRFELLLATTALALVVIGSAIPAHAIANTDDEISAAVPMPVPANLPPPTAADLFPQDGAQPNATATPPAAVTTAPAATPDRRASAANRSRCARSRSSGRTSAARSGSWRRANAEPGHCACRARGPIAGGSDWCRREAPRPVCRQGRTIHRSPIQGERGKLLRRAQLRAAMDR